MLNSQELFLLPNMPRAEVRKTPTEDRAAKDAKEALAQQVGTGVADRILIGLNLIDPKGVGSEILSQPLRNLYSTGISAEEAATLIGPIIEERVNSVLEVPSSTQANLNQARNLFNLIQVIPQKAVIEDRSLLKLKDSPDRMGLLEDYLRTLRDTLALKPDLRVRLFTSSEAGKRELTKLRDRMIDELENKEEAKAIRNRIEILPLRFAQGQDDGSPVDLVLVNHASPQSLKEFHTLQAFDSAEDLNGNPLDQVTPAARFLASLASLSEAAVEGLRKFEEYENGVRVGILVKAESEAAFNPFALLVQFIAQEARAAIHTASSA